MAKNAIVGQSGGPTSVINASLAGVYESCKRRGAGKVYGMLHGVAGLLERRTCVLDDKLKTALDIELLKRTPSSYLGSCRYKLPDWHTAEGEKVYIRLFEILKELDIGYFFYIGGNDSMDTIGKLADDVHAVDAFGHKALTGTARFLANTVARRLDTKTRCIELSTLQRCAGHLTSRTDITEAYQVGGAAAKAAFEGHTGEMVALDRISNAPYQCGTSLHPISEVANLEKKVPLEWVNADHTAMTDEFLAYALPLVQAELTPIYVEGLPHHIYLPEA